MFSGLVRFGVLEALGRSIFTEWVSSGAVMMKITSSTSITSMSGIMLISAIGALPPVRLKFPKAISGALLDGRARDRGLERHDLAEFAHVRAGGQHGVKVVRKGIERRQH